MISMSMRAGMVTLSAAAVVATALGPLRAQDADSVYGVLLQSWRQQERSAEPQPRIAPRAPRSMYSPYVLDHRFPPRPPRTVREKKRDRNHLETAKPNSKDSSKTVQIPSNPHLALMTDPTLRPGDIVMFPDGPRVFQGDVGKRHAMSDFVPFSKAKGLTKADRRYLTALRTGVNEAWVEASADRRVAQTARDVETTGSISRKPKGR
jgi:hypothetical protein